MACHSVRPRLLQNHVRSFFLRHRSTTAPFSMTITPPLNFTEGPNSPTSTKRSSVKTSSSINLDDPKELFSSISTAKLIKSSLTLYMASIEPMVDMGMWVMHSRLMENPLVRKVVLDAVEYSFYEHFCAGVDLKEADRTVKKLWDSGLRAMLDYGLEHAIDNDSCDRNMEEFIQTIKSINSRPTSPVSFVVVKITAICPPTLLKRVSDLLRWEYKDKSLHLPWKLKTFRLFSDSSPLYQITERPDPLTIQEECDLQLAYDRLNNICKKGLESNISLLIDAEDTTIQPAIDYFSYSAAIEHPKDDYPLIYNTVQAYLKDAKERLVLAKRDADKMGVPVGFKLVRGAYMSSEKRLASSLGVKSPIHESIRNTHACYNECADFMLEEIANGTGSVVLATHNLESGKLAAAKATDLGIDKNSQNLQFAQLYGMAEALSFGLRNAGFRVSKYLPFGPVDQIMPYLLRRAEENKGMLATSSIDRTLMRKEIFRRITGAVPWHI